MSTVSSIRSITHLLLILSITAWGFLAWTLPLPGLLVGFGMLIFTLIVWALFLSPKPVLAVDRFGQSIVELLLIAGAVGALLAISVFWVIPVTLGIIAVVIGYIATRVRSE